MDNNEVERFVADNVSETIWLRLRRLTSSRLCEQLLNARNTRASRELMQRKSAGMSSAIRSALGFWDTKEGGLNAKLLSRYYALLQISIAEQIGSLDTDDDLASVQRHTEYGHGLFTLNVPSGLFPSDCQVGCLKSGHFPAYAKSLKVDLGPYAFERRPRDIAKADASKLISLADLLRRVPELQRVVREYLGLDPLSFHVGHATRNHLERSARMRAHAEKHGEVLMNPPQPGDAEKTYVAVYPHGASTSAEELNSFGFEIRSIEPVAATKELHSKAHFVGEVIHPKGTIWWDFVDTYKSGYCGTSVVVPLWGSRDPFLLHLSILYAFSIVARYLPETWHQIEHGELDNVRALIEHYLVIVDNVLPLKAVERLSKKRLVVAQPGGLNAPI